MQVIQHVGGNQFDFVETFPAGLFNALTVLSANAAYLTLVRVARPIVVTQITYGLGTASGNVDLGIYDSADGGTTLTRLGSTGSTAATGTNTTQTIALTAAVTLVPGKDYWLAFAVDNATLTPYRGANQTAPSIGGIGVRSVAKATAFPLPTSITGHSGGSTVWMLAN